jgi:hypothetical protein
MASNLPIVHPPDDNVIMGSHGGIIFTGETEEL